MIIYCIKTILLLGIFYGLYLFLLKRQKSFKWNRSYLLFTALITCMLPFIDAFSFGKSEKSLSPNGPLSVTLDTITIYATSVKSTEIQFGKIVFAIYVIGLLYGLLRLVLGYIVINRIKTGSLRTINAGRNIYFNDQIETPFSFNKNIYIPYSLKGEQVLDAVIQHEVAHIEMQHSRDKVLFVVLQALFWFNPFVYLYHKEMELVHEFEADAFATQEIPTDEYVAKLIETVANHQTPTLLVHHFFHHPIKTRITMLYKNSKTALLQQSIVAIATLVICILTLALQGIAQENTPKTANKFTVITYDYDTIEIDNGDGTIDTKLIKKSDMKLIKIAPDTLYETADIMPEFYGGEKELINYISSNLKYPELESKNGIQGRVVVSFIVDTEGQLRDVKAVKKPTNGENLAREAVRVVQGMPKWKPGKIKGKAVKVHFALPISFSLK